MKSFLSTTTLITASLMLLACESGSDGILEIAATGALGSVVYIDRNLNGQLEASDLPAGGVSLALTAPNAQQVIARTTSNASGIYLFENIAVGRYSVLVEALTLGDSLQVAS